MESKIKIPLILWKQFEKIILNENLQDLSPIEEAKKWAEETGLGYSFQNTADSEIIMVVVLNQKKFELAKRFYLN